MPPPLKLAVLPDSVRLLTVTGPASASELTVRPTCESTSRSSSASSRGRKRPVAGRSGVRLRGVVFDVLIGRKGGNHIARSFPERVCVGENTAGPGAQTVRRGG